MNIFFDCFGTLVDTEKSSLRATKSILMSLRESFDPVDFYKVWKQLNSHGCYEDFQTENKIFTRCFNETLSIFGSCKQVHNVDILMCEIESRKPYSDALNVVKRLSRQYNVFVASNSDTKPLIKCTLPFKDYVSGIYSSEDFQIYKPNSDFFLKMLNKSDIRAEEAIYVGDSILNDFHVPQSLGIESYLVNRSDTPNTYGFPSLTDVAKFIINKHGLETRT